MMCNSRSVQSQDPKAWDPALCWEDGGGCRHCPLLCDGLTVELLGIWPMCVSPGPTACCTSEETEAQRETHARMTQQMGRKPASSLCLPGLCPVLYRQQGPFSQAARHLHWVTVFYVRTSHSSYQWHLYLGHLWLEHLPITSIQDGPRQALVKVWDSRGAFLLGTVVCCTFKKISYHSPG